MKITLKLTGQSVEVSDEYGDRLVEEGLAEGPQKTAEAPKKAAPARPHRTPRKTAQKPAQTEK